MRDLFPRINAFTVLLRTNIIIAVLIFGCGGGTEYSKYSENASPPPLPPGPSALVWSTAFTWDAPTTNADGTPLIDLAGYRIYWGETSGNYDHMIDVGNIPGALVSFTVSGLSATTYYFSVTAYDELDNESPYSNEVLRRSP